jgi:plasmid segregation protein ParM
LCLREVENDGGRICFYGRQIDLSGTLEKVKKEVSVSIIDQVRARLGDRAAFIRRAYLAGGGAYSLPQLASIFPVTSILPEAQWANALGYFKGVGQLEAKQNKG